MVSRNYSGVLSLEKTKKLEKTATRSVPNNRLSYEVAVITAVVLFALHISINSIVTEVGSAHSYT